jgi:hypothetical protein
VKSATVRAHARKLRRICAEASYSSMVPGHLPNDPVLVGDLPAFVFIKIVAWAQAGSLADSLRAWIKQGGHQ